MQRTGLLPKPAATSPRFQNQVSPRSPQEQPAESPAFRVTARPWDLSRISLHAPQERGLLPQAAPAVEDVLRQAGHPLRDEDRSLFEARFGHDFSRVRVHADSSAAQSALKLAARAWTYGDHIAFGDGKYSPSTQAGRDLLAHELAHVVQQSAAPVPLIQRSALSDSLKSVWAADQSVEALLQRLSQPDIQNAQSDKDVDAELARILAAQPDDLWVAQRIRKGKLGDTTGALGPRDKAGKHISRPIQASFIRGTTDQRALVIAGVHGEEQQGVEVAQMLVHDLQTQQPRLTTIVVPSLFPDTDAAGIREGDTPTNRNFPPPSQDLAAARAAGHGKPVDAAARAILPENVLLLELIERFHPERIISIHGTWQPGAAGVFYDQRTLTPFEIQSARSFAAALARIRIPQYQQQLPSGQERVRELEERYFRARIADLTGRDRDLSAAAATEIDKATAGIPGRESRSMEREKETPATTRANRAKRQAHPSIGGNVGPSGDISNFTWLGGTPGGVSLGGYAPSRGISVFTVEPPIDVASKGYPTKLDEKVTAADRKKGTEVLR